MVVALIGTKARNLQVLRDTYGMAVPPFIVLPFESLIVDYFAVKAEIEHSINTYLNSSLTRTSVLQQLQRIRANLALNYTVAAQLDALPWATIALRTSAEQEDGTNASFAGQYVSFIDRPPGLDANKANLFACFDSMFSERVIEYARVHGYKKFTIDGAVIVQQMFYGAKSGVLFSEAGDGNVIVAYSDGWRNTTVDGASAEMRTLPKTADARSVKHPFDTLTKIAAELQAAEGYPLDIEWAATETKVVLLQMRPITTPLDTYELSWDCTNISENYPGVTLPLTYSFIRKLYANVYPAFFRMMGTPRQTLHNDAYIFDNALGYLHGHVYYRIDNWYEIVRMIPGKRNQAYFEAMLNPVKKRAAKLRRSPLTSNRLRLCYALRGCWLLLSGVLGSLSTILHGSLPPTIGLIGAICQRAPYSPTRTKSALQCLVCGQCLF